MCFCLRRANRLLPNQLSFPLRPTSRARRGYDADDEEQGDPQSREGLLSHDYNEDDPVSDNRYDDVLKDIDDDDEEEFGEMQGASPAKRSPLFSINDDSDNEDQRHDNR